jgi:hypothetical protein
MQGLGLEEKKKQGVKSIVKTQWQIALEKISRFSPN